MRSRVGVGGRMYKETKLIDQMNENGKKIFDCEADMV